MLASPNVNVCYGIATLAVAYALGSCITQASWSERAFCAFQIAPSDRNSPTHKATFRAWEDLSLLDFWLLKAIPKSHFLRAAHIGEDDMTHQPAAINSPVTIQEILEMSDTDIRHAFETLCDQMQNEGLVDIKFCLDGTNSVEAVQRQILLVEKMHASGQTREFGSFELFNSNYVVA